MQEFRQTLLALRQEGAKNEAFFTDIDLRRYRD